MPPWPPFGLQGPRVTQPGCVTAHTEAPGGRRAARAASTLCISNDHEVLAVRNVFENKQRLSNAKQQVRNFQNERLVSFLQCFFDKKNL
jgi:hypothetical protein